MTIFIETPRLTIKPSTMEDFDALYHLQTDADVMKYIGGIRSKEKAMFMLTKIIEHHQKHGFSFCSVFEKNTGKLIGQAGLFYLAYDESQPEIELGYRLHKDYWGRGYATELSRALIKWGFDNLKVNKLVAVTDPGNLKSRNVLEKIGFIYIGETLYHNQEVPKFEIYKDDLIELVPYSKEWPIMAKNEIKLLRDLLPEKHIVDIQHVGSTAIPNILSKPIIDIQIAVDSLELIKQIAIDKLKSLGYVYWESNPDKERMFFVKGMPPYGAKRTHHVHIVKPNSKHWQNKIMFRDYLLGHPEAIRDYENLKTRLAKEHTYDREKYTEAKGEFVNCILDKAKK